MPLNTKISNLTAKAACDAIVDRIDLGSGTPTGILRIYDGVQPIDVDVAVGAQILLAELTLSNPAFGSAVDSNPGATATANAITGDASANATGTASWFRVFNRDNVAIIDGSVGTSGADLLLGSVSISTGIQVNVTSWTITVPEY